MASTPLAQTIRRLRRASGLDQRELAAKVGVSTNWISTIERGGRCSVALAHMILTTLGAADADAAAVMRNNEPIPMLLWCPECFARHIDEGEFATKPHHTHACQHCGHVWRPAIVPTTGVQFLPGFKNAATAETSNEEVPMKNT